MGGECRSSLSENDRGQAITGKEIFFMGIIDYLQYYNRKRAAENFFKGFRYDRTWAQPPPPNRARGNEVRHGMPNRSFHGTHLLPRGLFAERFRLFRLETTLLASSSSLTRTCHDIGGLG